MASTRVSSLPLSPPLELCRLRFSLRVWSLRLPRLRLCMPAYPSPRVVFVFVHTCARCACPCRR
eukprot:3167898-Prymnesium_polylepis.1